jgi:hypothetical protein
MMIHPDQLFEAAKRKLEENQQESRLANAQARQMRHWLAVRVRYLADRLEPVTSHLPNDLLPLVKSK